MVRTELSTNEYFLHNAKAHTDNVQLKRSSQKRMSPFSASAHMLSDYR